MINTNVYFLLGYPCAGRTTIGNILAQKYKGYYFSGDNRRFDYYKLAEKEKFMRDATATAQEMDGKVERHFGLA